MRTLSLFKQYPIAFWPVWLLIVCVLLTGAAEWLHDELRFDRQAILQGQWWRLLTAHYLHLGWIHTALNGGGLLLLAWMQPRGPWYAWLMFYCLSAIFISVMLLQSTQVNLYVGASGVLHGLFILVAYFSAWLEPWRRYLLMAVVMVKLLWEQSHYYQDGGVGDLIGGYVVVDAHWWGGMFSLLILILLCMVQAWRSSKAVQER